PVDARSRHWPYAPKHRSNVRARYSLPAGSLGDAGLEVEWYQQSSFATNSVSNTPFDCPNYHLFNLRAELNGVASGSLDLALFINNVTNEEYWSGSSGVASVGASVYYPGPPRMYGIEAKYSF